MLQTVIIMGGLGLIVGAGLALASKLFYVYVDPLILSVDDVLPGANCGGCGFPGCSSNAEAIVIGEAAPNSCVVAGPEVAETIADILGVTLEVVEPSFSRPGCTYGPADADTKYLYDGLSDCRAAVLLSGGMKVCSIGCLGMGSCVKACKFNALVIGPEGLPVVDEERCTGCGACERVCPKHIITLSSVTRRIIREYTSEDCTTPCQRACPAGIDVCEYIRQAALGNYERSVQVVKERNPFPGVIGRICPRPCEQDCRRQLTDEPVGINFIKRYVADYEMKLGRRVQPYKAPHTGRKVAIIGGGAEGLSTAFFTARLGHEATVFEATDHLGGLLRSAIAANRLPLDVLDWDIQGIIEMGVHVETGNALGKEITITSLLAQDYEAVFLASGGWDSRLARGAAGDAAMPVPGTSLLIDVIKSIDARNCCISMKSDVVIIGGGALALQAAEYCRQKGPGKITIIFREGRDACQVEETELSRIESQGVNILFNAAMTRLFGEENHLTGLEVVDISSSTKTIIPVGSLLVASARMPELVFVKADTTRLEDSGPLRWEGFESYKRPEINMQTGLFSAGDVVSDFSATINAIAAGRRGAVSMHKVIHGIPLELPETVLTPNVVIQNVEAVTNVKSVPRRLMPVNFTADRNSSAEELESGYTEEMMQKEAERCLQCGLICYKRTAQTVQIQPSKAIAS